MLLISKYLNIQICHAICLQLKNMQLIVTLGENVKNDNVFIMQTMGDKCERLNEILLELLQLASVCKSGDASSITAGTYQIIYRFFQVFSYSLLTIFKGR